MNSTGQLYVVATPIGNLADFSQRAIEVLQAVDLILAEDTRHSRPLLQHYQIDTPCKSFHEHNEKQLASVICDEILGGKNIALISDAGTPLISDPGFPLVKLAHEKSIRVFSIPGPCAAITAIAGSGLPVDRFSFEGFLPHKSEARKKVLKSLEKESRSLIFYESPHRIEACLADMAIVFGEDRPIVLARELTKLFETFLTGTVADVIDVIRADPNQKKGEMVVLVEGATAVDVQSSAIELENLLLVLLAEVPLKKAVSIAVKLTGQKKNHIYQLALELQNNDSEQ